MQASYKQKYIRIYYSLYVFFCVSCAFASNFPDKCELRVYRKGYKVSPQMSQTQRIEAILARFCAERAVRVEIGVFLSFIG